MMFSSNYNTSMVQNLGMYSSYAPDTAYNGPMAPYYTPNHEISPPQKPGDYMSSETTQSDHQTQPIPQSAPQSLYPPRYGAAPQYNSVYPHGYPPYDGKPHDPYASTPALDKIKTEPSDRSPEILDLDSQKVLGNQENGLPANPWEAPENTDPSQVPMHGFIPQRSPGGINNVPNGRHHPYLPNPPPKRFSSTVPQTPTMMMGLPHQVLSEMDSGLTYMKPSKLSRPPSKTGKTPSNVKREKSHHCDVCNKWFTSHGHLKRHYSTNVHNNATKELKGDGSPASLLRSSMRPDSVNSNTSSITPPRLEEPTGFNDSPMSSVPIRQLTPLPQPTHLPPPYQPVVSSSEPFQMNNNDLRPNFPEVSHHLQFQENPQNQNYPPVPSYQMPPPEATPDPFFANNNMYSYTNGVSCSRPVNSTTPVSSTADALGSCKIENEDSTGFNTDQCDSRSTTENSVSSLDSPESIDFSDNKFACPDCPKTFNRMCYLTQHRTSNHEGEKPFKCQVCGKRFTTETQHDDHRKKHTGAKPFKCERCPKDFNHKTDLRRHMCLHTGEKPFVCDQCNKGFIRKDHMKKHKNTHLKKPTSSMSNGKVLSPPTMMPIQMPLSSPSNYSMGFGGSLYMPATSASHQMPSSLPSYQNGLQGSSSNMAPIVSLPSMSGSSLHSNVSSTESSNPMVSTADSSHHYGQLPFNSTYMGQQTSQTEDS